MACGADMSQEFLVEQKTEVDFVTRNSYMSCYATAYARWTGLIFPVSLMSLLEWMLVFAKVGS
jgi:hypothetical protein